MRGPQPEKTLVLGTTWIIRVNAETGASSIRIGAGVIVSGVSTG